MHACQMHTRGPFNLASAALIPHQPLLSHPQLQPDETTRRSRHSCVWPRPCPSMGHPVCLGFSRPLQSPPVPEASPPALPDPMPPSPPYSHAHPMSGNKFRGEVRAAPRRLGRSRGLEEGAIDEGRAGAGKGFCVYPHLRLQSICGKKGLGCTGGFCGSLSLGVSREAGGGSREPPA